MRILWLYKYLAAYNFDHWFHLSYVRHMKQMGYDVIAYGPELEKEYSDIAPFHYAPPSRMKWDLLLDQVKPDVAILNTRSRAWDYYNPFTGEMRGCWLPKGFESERIPKVLIDEDSHYEKDDNWVYESNFNLTLQRHYSQAIRTDWKVKTMWLPFSVNIDVFNPGNQERANKICFTGSLTAPYSDRIRAISALQEMDMIDVFPTRVKTGQDYIACLRNYKAALSGASDYDICAAKNFEIMATGSALLTNRFSGLDKLFPEDSYFLYDNNEESIVETAKSILQSDQVHEVTERALQVIYQRHTDEIRTRQMIDILEKEL